MILILGQGLAGTLLGWELERAGIPFALAEAGRPAASAVAAGMINPITGQRLVKSWRIETLLPLARAAYRAIEAQLGIELWHQMRVRRLFAHERERARCAEKRARSELAPFAGAADEAGFWIHDAARVDVPRLLAASRERWQRTGRIVPPQHAPAADAELTIDCTGAAIAESDAFAFVPWEFSKGEILEIAVEGLAPDVILNRRDWIVPVAAHAAWVGATHEPGVRDTQPTAAARQRLEIAARTMLRERPFQIARELAGVRVNLPDKRPVAGRHPANPQLGLVNGLAAKGALWAPFLARQWAAHLRDGVPFDAEIDVRRFAPRSWT